LKKIDFNIDKEIIAKTELMILLNK